MFPLADRDAARQCSLVVVNAIVGDFQVVGPSVYVDAAASLGTVGNRQAVNARRVALEAARESDYAQSGYLARNRLDRSCWWLGAWYPPGIQPARHHRSMGPAPREHALPSRAP